MRKLSSLFLAIAVLAAACGGDDTDDAATTATDDAGQDEASDDTADGDEPAGVSGEPADEPTEEPAEQPTEKPDEPADEDPPPVSGDTSALCALGEELEADDPFNELTLFDGEEFFEVTTDAFDRVRDAAPSEIRDDVEIISDGWNELREIFEQYDYDLFNAELQAQIETFDTTEIDEASDRFGAYLLEACGIDIDTPGDFQGDGPAAEPIDPADLENLDDPASVLQTIFGVDEETARCLVEELGGFDPENIDPTTLNDPICGTTLLEVVTGGG